MTAPEPTRERVRAYEAALGCKLRKTATDGTEGNAVSYCSHFGHEGRYTDLGCPVAVAAARVEAERVAEVEAERDALKNGLREMRRRVGTLYRGDGGPQDTLARWFDDNLDALLPEPERAKQ